MAEPLPPETTLHLDLQFTPGEEDTYVVRVLHSPAGSGGRHEFALPFTPEELAKARAVGRVEANFARQFGLRLYEAAFGGEVRQLLVAALRSPSSTASGEGRLLQVRFWLSETPALATLPWEYLYIQELGLHLALMQHVSVIRHLDVRRRTTAGAVPLPLAVLCVIAAPEDLTPVDAEGEWQRLERSFAPLKAAGLVQVERLAQPSFGALAQRLDAAPVHVLHFVGHGLFDTGEGSGGLVFEDAARGAQVVSADQLAQVLGNHPPLRLVVINACQGAQSAADDASAGVAQRLVAGGTPSVAAMQFAITDKAAALFSSEFYAALGRGLSVDEAMQRARQAIYTQPNAVEWATPVLFAAKGEPLRIVAREPMYATEPVESMAANSAADTAVPTTERSAKQVGTGPKNRPWLLAAVGTLALIAIFAFAWLGRGVGTVAPAPSAAATAHATTTIAGEATTVPGGTSTATPPANALAGTQESASTPLPTARPPITVGLASLAGCVLEGVDADYREALADPLRNTRLLGNRIIMVDVPSAIGNAADALAAGKSGGYDIVLWGACAPGAEGGTSSAGGTGAVSETLTVTATLLLVGDTADEALAHRLAQPDAVALSVDSEQAALVGEALASVLAYYGEDNIEYAARLLDSIAARLDTVDAATQWQRASFHWLAGNAFVEHPELVLGQYFNKERRVSPYYREQGILHFARAISLTLSLSPSVPVGPIVAALHQNRGWMHIRIADPVLMEAEYAHALEDFTLSTAYAPPTEGAIEGLVAAQQWLGLGKDELVALCEPLAMLDPAVRYRNCRTYAEIYQEGANLAAMRQLAGAVLAIAPHDAPSEYFLALVACDLEHDSARAILHHQRYEAKARIAPRWDIFGWELERHLSADILRNILADPVTACGTS